MLDEILLYVTPINTSREDEIRIPLECILDFERRDDRILIKIENGSPRKAVLIIFRNDVGQFAFAA